MRRMMLILISALLVAGGAVYFAGPRVAGTPAAMVRRDGEARPRRIVSLNLCADQLVLALADRDQIAAVTRNAINPDMSAEAEKARTQRLLSWSAEDLVLLEPDLVIGVELGYSGVKGLLAGQDYPTLDLPNANSLGEIFQSIRSVAGAIGQGPRGEAMIATMERDLARIPARGAGRVAAYYQRRGFMTGTGTLVDDMLARAGLVNLAAKLGKPALSQLSVEEMVAARPDFIIVESATERVSDRGSEMLHHPALRDIPRIRIPEAWTVCGGPAYVRAVTAIAEQIATASSR